MRIARAILVKIPAEMCQFTGIPMIRLKVSFILQKICSERIIFGMEFLPSAVSEA